MDESQGNSDKMQPRCVDDTFAQFTSFGTAYLRAIESMRSDRIVNDPFAGRLTRQKRVDLEKFFLTTSKPSSLWGDFIAIRTRYLDEALEHRDGNIRQIVILGAGLDTRAFRLDSLHGCHIFEIDQSGQAFERMDQVMKEENVPLIAKKADYIVANLADDDWDSKLLAHGFDPSSPTFWIMEGLLPYMKRSCILTCWTHSMATFNFGDTAVTMKYSDDDPLHGVLSKIPWCLRLQASLKNGGIHFGRKWTPLISQDTNKTVSITFIMGKKPVSSEARLKDVCPGLDY
ncbi:hypothetical protein F442_07893 [Phytophthora nicotianae P10297]|uniref:O-methyltransferase domain-containing protein n=1 Tax=Phytophthora nicotianae P10297 TaxID=1317064 RepID=W2ZHW2_PHYNI|nr:hypothetical protein F442_07893 [Phytophthora nicotianae P10297]